MPDEGGRHAPSCYGISDGDPIYDAIREEWEPVFEQVRWIWSYAVISIYICVPKIGNITYVMGNSGKRRSTYFNGENVPEYVEAINATDSNYQIIKVSEDKLTWNPMMKKGRSLINGLK